MSKTFANLIFTRRSALRLSLSEAAKATGLSKPHLWQMEQSRAVNPAVSTLEQLATGYKMSAATLFKAALDDCRSERHLQPTAGVDAPRFPPEQAAPLDSFGGAAVLP